MKINKHKIEDVVLGACVKRMKSLPFKAADIEAVAEVYGVPKWVACRVADRLIQRHRKAGSVKVGSPYPTWTWVGK